MDLSAYHSLLTVSFEAYLSVLESEDLKPSGAYLGYEFDFIKGRNWHLLGEAMVLDELRELTNVLNHWRHSLLRWDAWNRVISTQDEDTAWELRREFLEALAHECLLRPSSVRDTFSAVATNALHQARLSSENTYKDFLDGDPRQPNEKPRHLTRRKKEERLHALVNKWTEGVELLAAIRALDGTQYKEATSDYRNLSSHTIGPRLGIGQTRAITRKVVPSHRMEQGADGFFHEIIEPNKLAVQYGFGGTEPLNLELARVENEKQFNLALACYERYLALLKTAVSAIALTT